MTRDDYLFVALAACVAAMRRSDPTWCAAMGLEQVSDVQWDAAIALGENALDAVEERA